MKPPDWTDAATCLNCINRATTLRAMNIKCLKYNFWTDMDKVCAAWEKEK